ncbi:hypothetical protein [Methanolobus sp.]|jgi:hypothetical protein|uniref:hypothetical protein n=1 Tax=Methanolobus sp. TaxID=1874737 RepID=UPI0025F073A9|nr:hypothetical protein [Methanolobus sp.]
MIQKNRKFQLSENHIRTVMMLFAAIGIALITMSSATLAQVSDYTVSPEDPSPGDKVIITGEASPGEKITITVTFEDTTSVSGGMYSYPLYGITIPGKSESFSVASKTVNDLDVEIKMPIIGFVSIPQSLISVNNGVATFGTSKINSGTYDIILSGSTPNEAVTVSFSAKTTTNADSNGYFEYTYDDTMNMPEGNYTITIDGVTKEIAFDSTTSSGRINGGSNTGTEFKIVPADSLGSNGEGTGEEGISRSTTDGADTSTEDTLESTPEDDVEGTILEQQTPIYSNLKVISIIGVVGVAIGLIGLGAIRNRKKI